MTTCPDWSVPARAAAGGVVREGEPAAARVVDPRQPVGGGLVGERGRAAGIRGRGQVAGGVVGVGEFHAGGRAVVLGQHLAGGVVGVGDHLAATVRGGQHVAARVVGEGLGRAVLVGDGRQVAARVVAVVDAVAAGVGEAAQAVEGGLVGERGLQVQRVADAGQVALRVVGVAVLLAAGAVERDQGVARTVGEAHVAARAVADLHELAAEAEGEDRVSARGVQDDHLARRGVAVVEAHALGVAVALRLGQPAPVVVGEVVVRAVGVGDGQQGVALRQGDADIAQVAARAGRGEQAADRGLIRVTRGAVPRRRDRRQVLARGVVGVRGHAVVSRARPERFGQPADPARRVVLQQDLGAAGVGQAGQAAAEVAQGDAVAVRVLDIRQLVVGAELPDGAVGLGQAVDAAGDGQLAIVARGGSEGGRADLGERAIDPARPTQDDIAAGLHLCRDVPVMGPAAPQRAHPEPGDEVLPINPAEDQGKPRRRDRRIDRARPGSEPG